MELVTRARNAPIRVANLVAIVQQGNYFLNNIFVTVCNYFVNRFGVCCLFTVSAGSTTITENCTYIQNPNFPSAYSSTTGLTYTVAKCSPGKQVCLQNVYISNYK